MTQPIFSSLPSHWDVVSIREIAQINYGRALRSENRADEGSVPVYGSSGIVGEHNESLHPGPSVIIGRKGTVGAIYYVSEPFWCIDTAFYLSEFIPDVDIEFLSHVLRFTNLSRLSIVVGVPGISRKDIEVQRIPLPPLPEQRRIVAILRQADKLRQLRQEADEKAKQLLPALFYEMFGDPATNPKKWKTEKLGNLAYFITSGPRNWAAYYSIQGAKFIRVQNLTGHQINMNDMVFVSPPNTADAKRTKVKPFDILFSITGVVGLVAVAPENVGDAYVSQHVAIVRLKQDIDPTFVTAYLAHEAGGQKQIGKQQYGQTKPGFGLEDVSSIRVFLPPIALQRQFTRQSKQIEEITEKRKESGRDLDTLFQSLLAQALSGELTAVWREVHEGLESVSTSYMSSVNALGISSTFHADSHVHFVDKLYPKESVEVKSISLPRMYNDLSEEQRKVFDLVNSSKGYCTVETLKASSELPLYVIRQGLQLLAQIGLIQAVQLPDRPIRNVVYIPAYRDVIEEDRVREVELDILQKELQEGLML